MPLGLMMWGGGLENHLSPYVAIVGAAISNGITCVVPAICIAYVVDYYRPLAGETITILTAFKNTCAFALGFAVFPWLKADGPLKVSSNIPRLANP